MKKRFLLLVAVIVAATTMHAQDVYVATLNHEGTITEYYGASALTNAYRAAVNGDIITLSEGIFIGGEYSTGSSKVIFNKAITVRGAGMDSGKPSTTISGRTYFKGSKITCEGIIFNWAEFDTMDDATFSKCLFKGNSSENICSFVAVTNSTFTNCVFTGRSRANSSCNNIYFNNCYLYISSSFFNATFFNSFVNINAASNNSADNCNFTNCVIANTMNLFASNKVVNCVGIATQTSNTTNIFKNIPERISSSMATNSIFNSWSDAISTTNITPDSYELSEVGKAYLGVDGTEVGMLGGNYPYNPVVSIPRITKCEVAKKATADGKLSVNIEVTVPTD